MHVKLLLREAMASRLAMLGRVASNNRLGNIAFCGMWIDQAMAVGLALPTLHFVSWTCVCPPIAAQNARAAPKQCAALERA